VNGRVGEVAQKIYEVTASPSRRRASLLVCVQCCCPRTGIDGHIKEAPSGVGNPKPRFDLTCVQRAKRRLVADQNLLLGLDFKQISSASTSEAVSASGFQ